jgi:hypothetical protein
LIPIVSKKNKPIKYPTAPPMTENKVVYKPRDIALSLLASAIGIKKVSVGIGKKILSENEIAYR